MTKIVFIILFSIIQSNPSKRVLHIYAKDKLDKSYLEQVKEFSADQNGLKERDIVIKEHFKASGFSISLIGKDGLKKYTSKSILTLKKLYSIVDAMPMRKTEMLKN